MMTKKKVVVIGLDGATWDLIKPWVEGGKLPTFKKLMENGIYGDLKSTIPPATFPAWASLLTGKGPGKLGSNGFFERKENSYELRPVTLKWEEWGPIWRIINNNGREFVMINVPTTVVPTKKIKGVFITGPMFQGDRIAYPPEVESMLKKNNYKLKSKLLIF